MFWCMKSLFVIYVALNWERSNVFVPARQMGAHLATRKLLSLIMQLTVAFLEHQESVLSSGHGQFEA